MRQLGRLGYPDRLARGGDAPPDPSLPAILVVDGNSHSAPFGGGLEAVDQWPHKLIQAQGMTGWLYENFAVSGQRTTEMIADAAAQVDPHFNPERARNLLLMWEITNHISHTADSASTVLAAVAEYCGDRRATGFEVGVFTCLPRSSPRGDYEAVRQAVNATIRNEWQNFADLIIDVAADENLGAPGAYENRTYFQDDEIHLTPLAQTLVSTIVASQVP